MAHLDLDRGFALVARASLSGIDVIDPAVWVREKLAMALVGAADEPPLRVLLAALRSLHSEIMKRPERDRSWISVGALLFHGDDGVAIAAGDTPCLRYRDGALASLGRPSEEWPAGAPRGSLGSETQVRIEVVPLRPVPRDLYILSTRPLREGELAILARGLEGARTPGGLLRAALEGAFDTGRLAIRILAPNESRTGPEESPRAEADAERERGAANAALEIEPIAAAARAAAPVAIPGAPAAEIERATEAPPEPHEEAFSGEAPRDREHLTEERASRPAFVETPPADEPERAEEETAEETPPSFEAPRRAYEPPDAVPAPPASDDSEAAEAEVPPASEEAPDRDAETAPPRPPAKPRPALATVGEERPWYEPLALWGGGALAIIALALLVKAILPGILGQGTTSAGRGGPGKAPIAATSSASTMEILSDPPGAVVRLNGEPLPGRTPMTGIAVDPGIQRVELDWGTGGTWSDTVEVAPGGRLTIHPAIYGSIAFRSSEPDRVLDVYVDGAYAGTTPLALDRVTVGRHLIRFGGPGLTMTAQEVDVLRDVHVELVGNAGPVPAEGKLTVKSSVLDDEGFRPGKSDPIWIDGVARGATPFTTSLTPGMHSVRVLRRDFPAQVTVIEVKPGNEHFVTAEFGARSGEPLRFTPPESLSRSQPTPLTIYLPGDAGDTEHSVWLYAAAPGGSFQPRAMTRLAENARAYAALVPDEIGQNASKQIRVYFKATAPGGHEIYSEIYTIPIRE